MKRFLWEWGGVIVVLGILAIALILSIAAGEYCDPDTGVCSGDEHDRFFAP